MNIKPFLIPAVIAAITFVFGYRLGSCTKHRAGSEEDYIKLVTQVLPREKTKANPGNWGIMDIYTGMQTETYGTSRMFTAITDVRPGMAVHSAHRHSEEEFLLIIEGEGEWHVEGEKLSAKKGDLLYVAPWKMHGLLNTGNTNLTFFVIRWNSKGVPLVAEPKGDHGD